MKKESSYENSIVMMLRILQVRFIKGGEIMRRKCGESLCGFRQKKERGVHQRLDKNLSCGDLQPKKVQISLKHDLKKYKMSSESINQTPDELKIAVSELTRNIRPPAVAQTNSTVLHAKISNTTKNCQVNRTHLKQRNRGGYR